jgi:sialate O-acetylesterase
MVESWRSEWGQGDFPLYFVQIAPFRYNGPNESSSAELRDSQLDAMKNIKNSGMVSTVDIGDLNSIHPPEKIKVGNRLAYWALNQTYGFKSITPSGPIPNSAKVDGSQVVVNFDYVNNGLYNFNGPLNDFEIAGDDGIFYSANAKIYLKSIILESSNVKNPKEVRYGWKNYFEASLFNIEGLPASSFYIKELVK